jgi:hypothetical protein
MGLTTAPTTSSSKAANTQPEADRGAKTSEEKTINQVELGPGSQDAVAGSGEEWWDTDHFSGAMGMGFGSDSANDQPWAVLS